MASLLEQYESMYESSDETKTLENSTIPIGNTKISAKNEGILNLRSNQLTPIFSKNKINFRPVHPITHMVVSNNQLLLSMENCTLLKIDLLDSSKQIEIDLNPHFNLKSQKPIINDIFIDPSGCHCLISVGFKDSVPKSNSNFSIDTNIVPYENFYYYRKLSILTKMRGHIVTAVGWLPNEQSLPVANLNELNWPDQNNSGHCSNFLVGTNDGRIFETHLQSDDRFLSSRELSFWKFVCDLSITDPTSNLDSTSALPIEHSTKFLTSIKESICAINCFRLKNSGEFCILVATRNFFYQYLGLVNRQSLVDGSPYLFQIIQNPTQKAYKEMPGYVPRTKLDLFHSIDNQYPKSFGWLTKPGIFYGNIPANLKCGKDERIFDDASVIMYNELVHKHDLNKSNSNFDQIPMSFILTEFHLLLLYPSMLKIICVLNKEVIFEDRFISEPGEGVVKDPIRNTIWSFTKNSVYRYKIFQEDRNIWEIYLKKQDFELAKMFAKNDLIKMDKTICEEALYYFSKKNYKKSAQLFTQTKSKLFEEIALKFIELHDHNQEALKEFLMHKLSNLSTTSERTQVIILLLWLFEIILNQLATLENSFQDSLVSEEKVSALKEEYNNITIILKNLISNAEYKVLFIKNKKIIYDLILNHNNSEILKYFAKQIDDFECLIEHYCRRGEFNKALDLLKQEECLDLYYQYSPLLAQHIPEQLINCLIPLATELDFSKLIPSLVYFDHSHDDCEQQSTDERRALQCKEILRFLEFCVYDLQSKNSLVHNYLLALLIQYQPDKLLKYLHDVSSEENSELPYDLGYAARICMQRKVPMKTIVKLLTIMGAYEEAIEQSLSVNDVELAKQTAERIQNILNDQEHGQDNYHHYNQELVKRLWLRIAKYVIKNIYSDNKTSMNGNFDISMATSIMNDCPLLKIEDILPYFPEYLTIDHFKVAICQSLKEYNHHIESLREDMKLATESAQQIREEITKVRNRFTIVDSTDSCYLCLFPAIEEHFYSFPSCGHLFHHKCLVKEIQEYLSMDNRIKLEAMLAEYKSIQNQLQTMSLMTINGIIKNNTCSFEQNESISLTNRLEKLNCKIEDLISSECLLCGNLMIQTIDKPFIDPVRDREELLGWN